MIFSGVHSVIFPPVFSAFVSLIFPSAFSDVPAVLFWIVSWLVCSHELLFQV